jgi:hypothetical protein
MTRASARHVALEVGDFLGPLIDEQRDEFDIGMIALDAVGDVLEQDGLAGLGRATIRPRVP